jgi:hypothetical protein
MSTHLVRLSIVALAAVAALHASPADATSCGAVHEKYVFSCEAQRCVAGFRIGRTPAFGVCSRRPFVEDIDPEVADFLAPLIEAPEDGLYTIGIWSSYWRGGRNDGTLASLIAAVVNDNILSLEERGRTDLRNLEPTELRQRLDKYYGPSWLERDTAHGDVQAARRAAQDEARRQLAIEVASRVVYWVSFVAVLLWFIHSVHTYFRRLYGSAGTGRLASPVLAQLVIVGLGIVPLVEDWIPFWPGTMLIPTVVVTWMAEGWARFRRRATV